MLYTDKSMPPPHIAPDLSQIAPRESLLVGATVRPTLGLPIGALLSVFFFEYKRSSLGVQL